MSGLARICATPRPPSHCPLFSTLNQPRLRDAFSQSGFVTIRFSYSFTRTHPQPPLPCALVKSLPLGGICNAPPCRLARISKSRANTSVVRIAAQLIHRRERGNGRPKQTQGTAPPLRRHASAAHTCRIPPHACGVLTASSRLHVPQSDIHTQRVADTGQTREADSRCSRERLPVVKSTPGWTFVLVECGRPAAAA